MMRSAISARAIPADVNVATTSAPHTPICATRIGASLRSERVTREHEIAALGRKSLHADSRMILLRYPRAQPRRAPLRTGVEAEAGAAGRTCGGTSSGRARRAGTSRGPCTRRRSRRAGCPSGHTWCGTPRLRRPRHRATRNTPRPRRSSKRSSTRAPRPGTWRPWRCRSRHPAECSRSAWPSRTTKRHTRWARAAARRRPVEDPRR
jgi:hypothetical protein